MNEYPGTPADPNQPPSDASGTSESGPTDSTSEPGPAAPTPPTAPGSAHPVEPVGEPTMPITGSSEEIGYWERLAREQQDSAGASQNPYGQPGHTQAYPTQPTYGQQSPYGQAPQYGQQPYAPPMYGTGYAQAAPMHGSATTALVLGIIGLAGGMVCWLPIFAAPFAWAIGRKSLKEIEASQGRLRGQGEAKAGMVMGIIGTVLLILGIVAIVAVVAIGIAADSGDGYSSV